ncbi:aspartate aminotransferase family protein [Geomicrobium sp. JCM 19038]|uniref:aminotransferase family protein n=1 Tax=Geomicrobium sp. JCM 19038 TaxID=1460635 RepID=UPI00045F3492|nr:aspartate aminotransferase family protein [Geomicrobium sp. JCM 19038]GAK09217.1 adenosylmethionine-8-amino-7-oxononanoate aminotransferase [Geomicrobium sp. JCM 19038]
MVKTVANDVHTLIEHDKKHYIHPTSSPKLQQEEGTPLIFTSGEGVYANSKDGKRYFDGLSMLWNVNIGHGRKELATAAYEQMTQMAYASSFKGYSNEPAIKLAEKLASISPGDLNAVFYTSGGSESNDTAFKLARFYWAQKNKPKKRKIIALENAYHGVTIGAQTATAIPLFHNFSESGIADVLHAKAHITACENGDKNDPDYESSIRATIEREGADTIAAVILEPVQGSGGVYIPPAGYLEAVRTLCNEHEILFIADEVICGFGRTGKMFSVEHWGVTPDMMSIAKGISSGYAQLGGVMVNDAIHTVINEYDGVLAHGFTYSGHPTACAVALKNIEILENEKIVEHTAQMEKELLAQLKKLEDKHAHVANSRSIGMLAAFEVVKNAETGERFAEDVAPAVKVVDECFERQLILRALGPNRDVIAIAPPLTITKEEIAEMISIIDEALTASF